MPIVRFTGKVYPESRKLDAGKTVTISWGTSDLGFPLIITLGIVKGAIEAVCDVERFEDGFTGILLARSYQLAEAFVDLAAFGCGTSLRVEFDRLLKPGAEKADEIVIYDPELAALCGSFKFPPRNSVENLEFDNLLKIVLGDPTLMGSLRDLSELQTKFNTTPTNCGRVLDAIRKGISPGEKDKKKGWKRLHAALNADEVYVNWISAWSTETRHGEYSTPIYGRIIRELRNRTWKVMDRFIEFRKAGNADLDIVKFTRLVHDPSFPFPTP